MSEVHHSLAIRLQKCVLRMQSQNLIEPLEKNDTLSDVFIKPLSFDSSIDGYLSQ